MIRIFKKSFCFFQTWFSSSTCCSWIHICLTHFCISLLEALGLWLYCWITCIRNGVINFWAPSWSKLICSIISCRRFAFTSSKLSPDFAKAWQATMAACFFPSSKACCQLFQFWVIALQTTSLSPLSSPLANCNASDFSSIAAFITSTALSPGLDPLISSPAKYKINPFFEPLLKPSLHYLNQ